MIRTCSCSRTSDLLERAFERLDRRERVIVYLRYFENASQSDIARRLQVSQMHVSRLQQRALAKMKGLLAPRRVDAPNAQTSP